jgi:hypothetical protein
MLIRSFNNKEMRVKEFVATLILKELQSNIIAEIML